MSLANVNIDNMKGNETWRASLLFRPAILLIFTTS
jgi:hypothetical protein